MKCVDGSHGKNTTGPSEQSSKRKPEKSSKYQLQKERNYGRQQEKKPMIRVTSWRCQHQAGTMV